MPELSLPVMLDSIPPPLRHLPKWTAWGYEARGDKFTKVPYQPNGRVASVNDRSTWSTFEAAASAYRTNPSVFAGIGFVFSADDVFAGVDLDNCYDPATGEVTDWGKAVLELRPTYTEVSPSGRGLHLILPHKFMFPGGGSGKSTKQVLSHPAHAGLPAEIAGWNELRYFALTGHVFGNRWQLVDCRAGAQEVCRRFFTPLGNPAPATNPTDSLVNARALAAALTASKNQADGNDGSFRLFTVLCRFVEHDLSDQAALATVRAYEQQRPFPIAWADDEILKRLRQAEAKCQRGAARSVSNCVRAGEASAANGSVKYSPLSMDQIVADVNQCFNARLARVDNTLFLDDEVHGIRWMRQPSDLFGAIHRACQLDWQRGGKFVTKSELFAELQRTATKYIGISTLPHEPPLAGMYYCGQALPSPGNRLQELLAFFAPETEIDRDLICAALMTVFWGGPLGSRPAFAITSRAGRGSGKTTAVQMLAKVAGGLIEIGAGEDANRLITRLLSPRARELRVVLFDNVKTRKLSWDRLESLITDEVVSGHALFEGEGRRPNFLTWFLTMNGPSMATDMAQRTVFIHLARPQFNGAWRSQIEQFIGEHQQAIIADLVAGLRAPAATLEGHSRWSAWESGVLAKLPNAAAAQQLILERQQGANVDGDDASFVEDYFIEKLTELGYQALHSVVRIPAQTVARWYADATGDRFSPSSNCKAVVQLCEEGYLGRLSHEPGRRHGRCFIWRGADADQAAEIWNDLPARLARRRTPVYQ